MNLQRALCLLLPFTFTFTTACIDDSDDSLDVGETASELSTADWSLTVSVANSQYGGQVATLDGTTYMVHTGLNDKNMYWRKRTGQLTWSDAVLIPDQKTSDQVSLAAFNGFLYMVHNGESDTQAVWFSRFDPRLDTWTPNKKLSMSSDTGAPALAAFDGRLWIVGATEFDDAGNHRLWVATMGTNEVVSAPTNLHKFTQTRVSLAQFSNKLYMAYGSGGSIFTMTHALGGAPQTWSAASAVKAGPSGTTSQGDDAKLAVAGGYLHLVHTRPYSAAIWWTYWNGVNGCSWAPEVQPLNWGSSDQPASLTSGGPGLVLLREGYFGYGAGTSYHMWATEYSAPPPSDGLPQCGGVVGT